MTADLVPEWEASAAALMQRAWGIISNAGWNASSGSVELSKSPGWHEAAIALRDDYHVYLANRPDPQFLAAAQLALVLREISDIDLAEESTKDYDTRYTLVWKAMGFAAQAGYEVGVRIDHAEPKWPVVYVELPTGQVSWHMPEHAIEWDGHDSAVKRTRILEFIQQIRIRQYGMEAVKP